MKTLTKKTISNQLLPELKSNLIRVYSLGLLTWNEYLIYLDQLENIQLTKN